MLEPSKSAPDYDEQLRKFKEDNSSWGQDHNKIDIMKGPLTQDSSQPETNKQQQKR